MVRVWEGRRDSCRSSAKVMRASLLLASRAVSHDRTTPSKKQLAFVAALISFPGYKAELFSPSVGEICMQNDECNRHPAFRNLGNSWKRWRTPRKAKDGDLSLTRVRHITDLQQLCIPRSRDSGVSSSMRARDVILVRRYLKWRKECVSLHSVYLSCLLSVLGDCPRCAIAVSVLVTSNQHWGLSFSVAFVSSFPSSMSDHSRATIGSSCPIEPKW